MPIMSIKDIPPCIDQAVASTFSVQLGASAKVTNLTMSIPPLWTKSIDCLSSVQIESTELVGSLSIGFPKETFLGLLFKMIGETYTEITSENSDASGEMLNIIYASARKNLNENGFDFRPSIPTTVFGKDLALSKSNISGTCLFFECQSDLGNHVVILALRKKSLSEDQNAKAS